VTAGWLTRLVALLLTAPAPGDPAGPPRAAATPPDDADQVLSSAAILDAEDGFRVESLRLRVSYFDQDGRGYQSQANRQVPFQPGSERLSVKQVQGEIVARHGRFTHTMWVPVDVVTGASPDALDAVSGSSRRNEAGSLDLTTRYQASEVSEVSLRAAFHVEEPFRSWLLGAGGSRSFADGNTTLSGSLNHAFDWFDRFDLKGKRQGGAFRSSTNANVGLTQLLSPSTVGHLGYGATVQLGELSNTWNAVPLRDGTLGTERVPRLRQRHAWVARLAQSLPWTPAAAIKGMYRYYLDDWGLRAHSFEAQLSQRLGRHAHLRGSYRRDLQTGARFFTPAAPVDGLGYRTADSDLEPFVARTLGVMAALDLDFVPGLDGLHLDLGYDYYRRSNDLVTVMYTSSLGLLF
jgi:hypothetical protein